MKFFPLIWSNLKRKKLRTLLTVLSILVAFVLFGLLSAIKEAFTGGISINGANRLVVQHKVSLILLLPESYKAQNGANLWSRTRHASDLVWRHLPGPEKFLHAMSSGARRLREDVSRICPARRPAEGLARDAHGRDCRTQNGGKISLENRRQGSHPDAHLEPKGRQFDSDL